MWQNDKKKEVVGDGYCVSKKEIAFHTNLSPATVSNLSNQLMSDGFISVASFQKSSGGRGIDLFDEMYPDMMDEYGNRVVIDKAEKVKVLPCYEYDKLLLRGCADLAFEQFALQENDI